jgi:D-serine deaminase-like pyridoxal phosphate-dependent protein
MQPLAIDRLETPCLLVEEARMTRNIDHLKIRLDRLGATLRPHLKTCKSVEIARRLMPGAQGPATVSTLKEAEEFAAAGVLDILYAVGLAPAKLDRVLALRRRGVDLSIIIDSREQAAAVCARSRAARDRIPTLIEIDCDDHRAGVRPDDPLLVQIGRDLHEGGAELRGVIAHAGGSYDAIGVAALERAAEQERAGTVAAANLLRDAGLPCPVVSVGSTPTAHFARDLTGVTEVRAGVYVFFDLVMAGIGVCKVDDIALSVLTSVIGHQRSKGWILVDAGWMAMSRDRGTAQQAVDQGYGLACDASGTVYQDLIMVEANQEHGILALRPGSGAKLPELPVGTLLRILPNHACATAAQHDRYRATNGGLVTAVWPRFSGW